ncbi:MAG: hypothetical protein L0Y44_03170 [Phycisphaerales bacterium]|nr:hypothetical protein [Phycisphaerales bacterium]MCI0674221.1 hypothetical protein [Phycisphaerales bacterium]
MKIIIGVGIPGILSVVLPSVALAQSFNIDIGQPGAAPPSTYAAAGLAGQWLSMPCTQGVIVSNMVDINGTVTGVQLNQIGGTQTLMAIDPALSGDDATLMNDYLITHTATENCLFLSFMEPGEYEVLIYARMPAQPTILANTNVDQEPGNPDELVGGVWPGFHQEGISFSRHTAFVAATGPQAGKLGLHSGVPAGGSFAIGAAMNGVQIRRVIPGDINGDYTVNVTDLLAVIAAWGPCPAPPAACPADVAIPADGVVNIADLLFVVSNWG